MSEQAGNPRSAEKKVTVYLVLIAVFIGIAIFFAYSLGSDMAARDNARDAALEAGR
ncbi:hypothetical protein [Roseibium sp.]|uniref:hypothetical protein n=1 Tax=Roseibium sp. TaxID=1936156 RepID=UPI0032993980